jgi:hypothetical protein
MSTNVSLSCQFVEPHFIDSLGEEGLTAHEIAASLGVDAATVHRKLRRNPDALDVQQWRVMTYVISNDSNGLETETFALNTRAAKAFVAKYDNPRGRAYLDFLFDCEAAVLQLKPRIEALQEELSRKEQLIQKLRKDAGKTALPSKRKQFWDEHELVARTEKGIFGDSITRWEKKKKSDISQLERLRSKQAKIEEVSQGISQAQKNVNLQIEDAIRLFANCFIESGKALQLF